MKLSKDTIEDIDRICEDSVNHPVEEQDDSVAAIASSIAKMVTKDECDPMLDVLMAHQKWIEDIVKTLKGWDIEGHFKNLDKRVIDLEGKSPGKHKPKYK